MNNGGNKIMEQLYCKPVETAGLVSENVFMYPQFLIDNLFTEYKSYQLLNSSSKEFKFTQQIVCNDGPLFYWLTTSKLSRLVNNHEKPPDDL